MPLSECVHLPHLFASPQLGSSGVSAKERLEPGDGEALTERILALAGDRDLSASMGARARVAFEREWEPG